MTTRGCDNGARTRLRTPSRCEHDVKTYKMPSRLLSRTSARAPEVENTSVQAIPRAVASSFHVALCLLNLPIIGGQSVL